MFSRLSRLAAVAAVLLVASGCAKAVQTGGGESPKIMSQPTAMTTWTDGMPSVAETTEAATAGSPSTYTILNSEKSPPTGETSAIASTAPVKLGEPPTRAQLTLARQWADRAARANGDADPTTGKAVLSTRREAVAFIFEGDSIPFDTPVIVVELHGSFNMDQFDQPAGVTVLDDMKVDELILVFDLSNGSADVTTRSLSGGDPETDLAKLGPVAELPS